MLGTHGPAAKLHVAHSEIARHRHPEAIRAEERLRLVPENTIEEQVREDVLSKTVWVQTPELLTVNSISKLSETRSRRSVVEDELGQRAPDVPNIQTDSLMLGVGMNQDPDEGTVTRRDVRRAMNLKRRSTVLKRHIEWVLKVALNEEGFALPISLKGPSQSNVIHQIGP